MYNNTEIVFAVGIAFVMTYIVIRLLDRLKKRDAETEADAIVERARVDATNMRKEAELELKEAAIEQKEAADKELNKIRDEQALTDDIVSELKSAIEDFKATYKS